MRIKPRVPGKIVAITEQGAEVRLDDGREGFVSTTDFFWGEWVNRRDLSAGASLEFDVLGLKPDGRVLLGFEPIGEKGGHLLKVDSHRGPVFPTRLLSPEACSAILQRAQRVGKRLPEALAAALLAASQAKNPNGGQR